MRMTKRNSWFEQQRPTMRLWLKGFQGDVKDTISNHRELDVGEEVHKEIHKEAQLDEEGQTESVSSSEPGWASDTLPEAHPGRSCSTGCRSPATLLATVNSGGKVHVAELLTLNLNSEYQPNTTTHCHHRLVGSAWLGLARLGPARLSSVCTTRGRSSR